MRVRAAVRRPSIAERPGDSGGPGRLIWSFPTIFEQIFPHLFYLSVYQFIFSIYCRIIRASARVAQLSYPSGGVSRTRST